MDWGRKSGQFRIKRLRPFLVELGAKVCRVRGNSLFRFPCVHSPTNFDWSSLSLPRNEIFKSSRTNDNELYSFETERIGIPSLPVSGLSRDDVEPMRRTIRYSRLFCFILPCHRPSTVLQASPAGSKTAERST